MESFKCPVCKQGQVKFDEKSKKGNCDNCESIFTPYSDNELLLKKLGNKEFSESFNEMKNRQEKYRGLTIREWQNLAEGGLTDEEQEEKDKKEEQERKENIVENMIITTTPEIEDKKIKEYKGIVTGQVAAGINVFKDAFSGIRNVVGGKSKALQDTMQKMRDEAIKDIKEEAVNSGANAVVGVTLDFDEYAEGMLLLTVTGTAVIIE